MNELRAWTKEFPPFRLDLVNECLWHGQIDGVQRRLVLTPKAFALLRLLIERAGQLVTHSELLETVWPGVVVQPEVLKSQLVEVRRALGDDPRCPSFIETVHRRGYRFIAKVQLGAHGQSTAAPAPENMVGRQRVLGELRGYLQAALNGRPQVVCITGEPGIGKTLLADEFQRQALESSGVVAVRGQCVEGYGGKEAYYPMLEALGQLLGGAESQFMVQVVASRAPTWLVQFPNLLTRQHRETLHSELQGATRERMLREIVEALQAITARVPVLIVLEDLQWVDPATVDLISALARQRAPSRLMLVTTDRPVDLLLTDNPLRTLKRELIAGGLAAQIALECLTQADVSDYLTHGRPRRAVPPGLAAWIHRHTEGNPLFMVAAIEHLSRRGLISRHADRWQLERPLGQFELDVPEGMRQMIELQIERLSESEQRALEAASVYGTVFPTVVGAALEEMDPEHFEMLCERLARRHQIVRAAPPELLPDRGFLPQYEFAHALHREVLYRRLAPERRIRLHRRIGQQLELLFKNPPARVIAMLVNHFEQAGDGAAAAAYLRIASRTGHLRLAD